AKYEVNTKKQYIHIKSLASLLKHVIPVELKPDGFVVRTANKFYAMPDGEQHFIAHGSTIMAGIAMPNRFIGSGYSPDLRLASDYGSTIYHIKRID
ncbi:MAG: alpha-galactosidase, partial [Oscillospiraceae bacterium]|nr:alpha-galactosidase [Oscillospiraceae bacterium]